MGEEGRPCEAGMRPANACLRVGAPGEVWKRCRFGLHIEPMHGRLTLFFLMAAHCHHHATLLGCSEIVGA